MRPRRKVRRSALRIELTLAMVLSTIAFGACRPVRSPHTRHPHAGSPSRPNLVLIVTDDQRWGTLWAMPNVNRLIASSGVTFTNAFATTTLCCPSRASILTGQYPYHHRVLDNDPPDGGAPAFRDRSTIASWLHDAGYTTALVGKYLNHYDVLGPAYVPPGWDVWNAIATHAPSNHYYGYELSLNGTVRRYGKRLADYSTTAL